MNFKDMDNETFAGFLKSKQTQGPSNELDQRVLTELGVAAPANAVDVQPVAGSRSLLLLCSMAAMLIFAMGFVVFNLRKDTEKDVFIASAIPTEGTFLFVDAEHVDTANPIAILHEMKHFQIVRKAKGDRVSNFQITEVSADGLGLKVGSGESTFHSQTDLQKIFDDACVKEIAIARTQASSGVLSQDRFSRLEYFSLLGKKDALELLEELSDSNSEFAASSRIAIGRRSKAAKMDQMVERALDPNNRYRENMIESLGAVHTPITISTLANIVSNAQESKAIRLLALDVLASFNDPYAVNALQSCLAKPDLSTDIQEVIKDVRAKMIQSWSVVEKKEN